MGVSTARGQLENIVTIPTSEDIEFDPAYIWYLKKKRLPDAVPSAATLMSNDSLASKTSASSINTNQKQPTYLLIKGPPGKYVGNVNQSKLPHGFGCYSNQRIKYEGQFENGKANGYGRLLIKENSGQNLYQGHFQDNEFQHGIKYKNYYNNKFEQCDTIDKAGQIMLSIHL